MTVKNPVHINILIFLCKTAVFSKKLGSIMTLYYTFVNVVNVCVLEGRLVIMFLHPFSG